MSIAGAAGLLLVMGWVRLNNKKLEVEMEGEDVEIY